MRLHRFDGAPDGACTRIFHAGVSAGVACGEVVEIAVAQQDAARRPVLPQRAVAVVVHDFFAVPHAAVGADARDAEVGIPLRTAPQRELAAVPEAQHGGFQAVVLRGVVDEPAVVGQRRRAHRQAGEGVVGRIGPVDDLPERKLVVEGRHAAQYVVPAGRSAVLRFQLPEMVHVEMGQQEVVERILVRHEMPHIPGVGAGRTREAVRLLGHAAVLFRFAAELTRIHRERRAVGQDEESALPAGRVDGVDVQTAFAPRREGFADPGLSAAASGGQNDRREQQQNEYPCFFHHFLI